MNFISLPQSLREKISHSESQFVLTGGGGWVGRAILDALESIFQDRLSEKVSVYGASDKQIELLSGRIMHSQPLKDIGSLSGGPKIFLHCAFLTKDRLSDLSPSDLVEKNREISDIILKKAQYSDTKGFFSLSSGAVYKKNSYELETDWEKNSYGMCKLADEERFSIFANSKAIPFIMPRLFNLSGAYINKHETYALASMIISAKRHGVINIRAKHQVVRSYILVDDLLALVFSCLLSPRAEYKSIFDTAGYEVLELDELAKKIKDILKMPNMEILRERVMREEIDRYCGKRDDLIKIADGYGIEFNPIGPQIKDTVNYLGKLYNFC
jgi:nucleoside-diphosphate-sugar epimerase